MPRTPEQRAKNAEYMRKLSTTPAYKAAKLAYDAEYQTRPEVKAKRAEYQHRRESPERRAARAQRNLMLNYGLTPEAHAALIADGCAICGTHKNVYVDHDHDTGEVRGALCSKHNTGLGLLGDSVEGLMAAVAYLRRRQ